MENKSNNDCNDSLSVLVSLIPDSVAILDSEGKIVATNGLLEKLSGYNKEQLIGKTFSSFDFLSKESKILLEKYLKKVFGGFNISPCQVKVKAKNGEAKYFEIKGNRITNQGQRLGLVIFHDVTAGQDIKNKLRCLFENQEKIESIINAIKEAVILVDDEARVTYWNLAAEKMFGYTSQEAVGKVVHKLVVPKTMCKEGKTHIDSSVKIFAETGTGYFTVANVQLTGRRKDSSEFPVELSISPIKIGEKWGGVGVVKDITQRRQDEQKIREAEQRYHALFNQAPVGVLVVDPVTAACVDFNETAHKQLGYSREEFASKKIFDLEAKETPQETIAHLKEMMETGGEEFETLQLTKNGEIRNVIVITRAFQSADKPFLHAIFYDITKSKKVENALRESETKYRQLVELAQEGIWAIDNDFVTIFVNPRMAQMLGYQESEMIGKTFFDFLDMSMAARIRGILTQFTHSDMKGQHDYVFHHKAGGHVNTTVNLSVITDDDKNQKKGILAVVSDTTERKRIEKELAEYSQKLEDIVQKRTEQLKQAQAELLKSERLAAIGELAGMIGHDLRNPLTGIKNAAYYLQKKGSLAPETQIKEMLQTIDKCVNYSNKVINDLLDYSREIHIEPKECSPRQLLAEALDMLDIPVKIEITNNLPDNPRLTIDPEKMQRVFINLTKNAVDALPNGGKISIDSKTIDDNLQIFFSDNGMGINEEIMPKLFTPLLTTKAQGMGFGLAICKRIIEAHGGTISVKTVKGKGTTFVLTLPIKQPTQIGGEIVWTPITES